MHKQHPGAAEYAAADIFERSMQSRQPRVHFINRYFYPDESATSLMLSGIAFGLASNGFDVHVASSRLRYEDTSTQLPADEIAQKVTIKRLRTTAFGRKSLIGRSMDYASFYAAAAWYILINVRHGDIVVAKTDPPLLSVVAGPMTRLKCGFYVNWLQDIFPEVAMGVKLGGGWTYLPFAALRLLRNWSLHLAHRNVAIGNRMAEYLKRAGAPATTIATIPNWADPDIVRPLGQSKLRTEWGLTDRIVVGYSGNLGRAHELATLVGAIEQIQKKSETDEVAARMAFIFVGSGAMRGQLAAEVERRSLFNVKLFPYQPLANLAETLAVPDIHLASLLPALEGLIVPSKIYGIMAAARPAIFVGAPDGELAKLLHNHRIGLTVEEGDSVGLADAVLLLARDVDLRRQMGLRAREVFERKFTRDDAVAAWTRLTGALLLEGKKNDRRGA